MVRGSTECIPRGKPTMTQLCVRLLPGLDRQSAPARSQSLCRKTLFPEYRQGGARAFPHHGFEGNTRHVDELAHFGASQQAPSAIGHPLGSAFESARRCCEHACDGAIVALLTLHSLAAYQQRGKHLRALLQVRYHASPFIQE